jgi:hypothetical protein
MSKGLAIQTHTVYLKPLPAEERERLVAHARAVEEFGAEGAELLAQVRGRTLHMPPVWDDLQTQEDDVGEDELTRDELDSLRRFVKMLSSVNTVKGLKALLPKLRRLVEKADEEPQAQEGFRTLGMPPVDEPRPEPTWHTRPDGTVLMPDPWEHDD